MENASSSMPETLSRSLQGWHSFYFLAGTAAAALIGWMYVAIALRTRALAQKDVPALRVSVSRTAVPFLYVMATAAVILIPTLTRTLLGLLLVSVGLLSCGRTFREVRGWRPDQAHSPDAYEWIWDLLVPSAAYLLFVGSGIGLLLRADQALTGLAVASLLLLVAGTRNAWDLVVWMVPRQTELPRRERGAERPAPVDKPAAERSAAPIPQPPKGHDEKPASLALPPAHQADVARVIQEAGQNPSNFTWAVQPSRHALIGPLVSALVHTPSGCFFRFEFIKDASGQSRVSVYSRGDNGQEVKKAAGSWEDQLRDVRGWLKSLRQHR